MLHLLRLLLNQLPHQEFFFEAPVKDIRGVHAVLTEHVLAQL